MKTVKSTKSGYDFQTNVENKLILSGLFGNNLSTLSNIYSYTDLRNQKVADINKFLFSANDDDMFLLKNYPLFNYVDEAIEFCIKSKNKLIVSDCYVECKFHDVQGTAYQKLYHYFAEHNVVHRNNVNSYMILVYDGDEFFGDTKTTLHVQNIKENYIKYNYRQLILEIDDFEDVFLEKLRLCRNISEIFKEMKKEGY